MESAKQRPWRLLEHILARTSATTALRALPLQGGRSCARIPQVSTMVEALALPFWRSSHGNSKEPRGNGAGCRTRLLDTKLNFLVS